MRIAVTFGPARRDRYGLHGQTQGAIASGVKSDEDQCATIGTTSPPLPGGPGSSASKGWRYPSRPFTDHMNLEIASLAKLASSLAGADHGSSGPQTFSPFKAMMADTAMPGPLSLTM